MKKKITAVLVMSALVVGAASCGNDAPASTTTTAAAATTTAAATEAAGTTTTEAAAETTTTAISEDAEPSESDVDQMPDEDVDNADEVIWTYEEYVAAELDTKVTVETYVQAKQSWWEDKATFYTQNEEGAYFIYNMPCSQEEYDKLVPGTKIKVTGYKSEWSGEVEITDAEYEILDGNFIAEPVDVTAEFVENGPDILLKYQNQLVKFTGMQVMPITDKDNVEHNFLYNYDGSGSRESNSDLYFNLRNSAMNIGFTVESYLCGSDTEVYQAVEGLSVGDIVDVECFLYWYEGPNPHVVSVTKN